MTTISSIMVTVLVFLGASGAAAQQQGGLVVVEQQAQPEPAPEEQSGVHGRGIEYGGHLVVPIFFDSDLNLLPGFGAQGRIGWEFPGGLTTELNIGAMYNLFTSDVADLAGTSGISDLWVGAGARFAFYNPSALVPFIGAGVALNFWNVCKSDDATTVCAGESAITFGFNGLAGVAYEISPFIAIEGGVQVNYSLKGQAFNDNQLYLTPFLGGTLYY